MARMPTDAVLVSDDLLFHSRLAAAVAGAGGTLRLHRGDDPPADGDRVFVDLNQNSGHRLGLIARLREQRPEVEIVGFCGHDARDLRVAAMAAGASQVITNGALQAAALRLAGVTPQRQA